MSNSKSLIDIEYVPITALVGLDKLPIKDSIDKFTRGRPITNEITQYLNWKKSSDELVSYCRGVYETEIPKKFDYLIDLLDNTGGIEIDAIIKHAIWNGIIPLNFIDLGYKTITIIKFKNGVPKRLNLLNSIEETDFKPRFALCSKSNKDEILTKLKTVANNFYKK